VGMKIPISYRSSTRFAWSVAKWQDSRLFPPQDRKAFHESVLTEILEERVVSSRSRCNPRGVKRKMSGYPLHKKKHSHITRIMIQNHIVVIK